MAAAFRVRNAMHRVESSTLDVRYLKVDNPVDFILAVLTEMGVKNPRDPALEKSVLDLALHVTRQQRIHILHNLDVYYFAYYSFYAKKSLWYLGLQSASPMGAGAKKSDLLARLRVAQTLPFQMASALVDLVKDKATKAKLYSLLLANRQSLVRQRITNSTYYAYSTNVGVLGLALHLNERLMVLLRDMEETFPKSVTFRCNVANLFPELEVPKTLVPKMPQMEKKKPPVSPATRFPPVRVLPRPRTQATGQDISLIEGEIHLISAKTNRKILTIPNFDTFMHEFNGNIAASRRALKMQIDRALVAMDETDFLNNAGVPTQIYFEVESSNDYIRALSYFTSGFNNTKPMAEYNFFFRDNPAKLAIDQREQEEEDKEDKMDEDRVEEVQQSGLRFSQVYANTLEFLQEADINYNSVVNPDSEAVHTPPHPDLYYIPIRLKRKRSDEEKEESMEENKNYEEQDKAFEEILAGDKKRLKKDYANETGGAGDARKREEEQQFLNSYSSFNKKITTSLKLGEIYDMTVTYTSGTPLHLFHRTLYVSQFNQTRNSVHLGTKEADDITEKMLSVIEEVFKSLLVAGNDVKTARELLAGINNVSYTNQDYYHTVLTKDRAIRHDMPNPLFYTLAYMLLKHDINTLKDNPVFDEIIRHQYDKIPGLHHNNPSEYAKLSFNTTVDNNLVHLLASDKTRTPKSLYETLGYASKDLTEMQVFNELCYFTSSIQFITDEHNFFGLVRHFAPDWLYQYIRQAYHEYELGQLGEHAKGSQKAFVNKFTNLIPKTNTTVNATSLRERISPEHVPYLEEALEMSEEDRKRSGTLFSSDLFDQNHLNVPRRVSSRYVGVAHFVELIMNKLLIFNPLDYEESVQPDYLTTSLQKVDTIANFFFFCYKSKVSPGLTALGRLLQFTQKIILKPFNLWYKYKENLSESDIEDREALNTFYKNNNERYDLIPRANDDRAFKEIEAIVDLSYKHFTRETAKHNKEDFFLFTGKDIYNQQYSETWRGVGSDFNFPLETQLAVLSYYIENHFLGGIPKDKEGNKLGPREYTIQFHTRLQLLQVVRVNIETDEEGEDEALLESNQWLANYLNNVLFHDQYVYRATVKMLDKKLRKSVQKLMDQREVAVKNMENLKLTFNSPSFDLEKTEAKRQELKNKYFKIQRELNQELTKLAAVEGALRATQGDGIEKIIHGETTTLDEDSQYYVELIKSHYDKFINILLGSEETSTSFIDEDERLETLLDALIEVILEFDRLHHPNENSEQVDLTVSTKLPIFDHTCDFWSLAIIKSICMDNIESPIVYRGLDPVVTIVPPYYLGLRSNPKKWLSNSGDFVYSPPAPVRPIGNNDVFRIFRTPDDINVTFNHAALAQTPVTLLLPIEILLNQWLLLSQAATKDYYLDLDRENSNKVLARYAILYAHTGFLTQHKYMQTYLSYWPSIPEYVKVMENRDLFLGVGTDRPRSAQQKYRQILLRTQNPKAIDPLFGDSLVEEVFLDDLLTSSWSYSHDPTNTEIQHMRLNYPVAGRELKQYHLLNELLSYYLNIIYGRDNFHQNGFALREFHAMCDQIKFFNTLDFDTSELYRLSDLALTSIPNLPPTSIDHPLQKRSQLVAGHLYRALALCQGYYKRQVKKWNQKVPPLAQEANTWSNILSLVDPNHSTTALNTLEPDITAVMKSIEHEYNKFMPEAHREILKRVEFMFKELLMHSGLRDDIAALRLDAASAMAEYNRTLNLIIYWMKLFNEKFDKALFVATLGHICTYDLFIKYITRTPEPMHYYFV